MKRTRTKKRLLGIEELAKGLYFIRIQEVHPRTGRMIDVKRRVRCETIEEAVQAQGRLRAEHLGDGDYVQPKRVRFGDYARSWLSGRLPTLKASTAARYGDTLDRIILPALGDYYLEAITPEDVLAWFQGASQGKAASTVNGYVRIAKLVLADASAQYRLALNPAARLRAVPERGEEELESDFPVNLLTAEEMARFMAALRNRWLEWYAMAFTQFATASRFSEVSALRWEDIDWERGFIRIRRGNWRTIVSTAKVDRRRRMPALTDELRGVLREHESRLLGSGKRHADSGWVFPSRVGKPHHNSSCMRKAFVDCLKVIGVERRFSSHGLRRTANDLIRRVASGEVARAITGHVTVAMTDHYSHVDIGEKRHAVEGMLRLVQGGDRQPANDADDRADVPAGEGTQGRTEKKAIDRDAGPGNRAPGELPTRKLSRNIDPKLGTSGRQARSSGTGKLGISEP
jgi:integrase